jgi:hypothetical protein
MPSGATTHLTLTLHPHPDSVRSCDSDTKRPVGCPSGPTHAMGFYLKGARPQVHTLQLRLDVHDETVADEPHQVRHARLRVRESALVISHIPHLRPSQSA